MTLMKVSLADLESVGWDKTLMRLNLADLESVG